MKIKWGSTNGRKVLAFWPDTIDAFRRELSAAALPPCTLRMQARRKDGMALVDVDGMTPLKSWSGETEGAEALLEMAGELREKGWCVPLTPELVMVDEQGALRLIALPYGEPSQGSLDDIRARLLPPDDFDNFVEEPFAGFEPEPDVEAQERVEAREAGTREEEERPADAVPGEVSLSARLGVPAETKMAEQHPLTDFFGRPVQESAVSPAAIHAADRHIDFFGNPLEPSVNPAAQQAAQHDQHTDFFGRPVQEPKRPAEPKSVPYADFFGDTVEPSARPAETPSVQPTGFFGETAKTQSSTVPMPDWAEAFFGQSVSPADENIGQSAAVANMAKEAPVEPVAAQPQGVVGEGMPSTFADPLGTSADAIPQENEIVPAAEAVDKANEKALAEPGESSAPAEPMPLEHLPDEADGCLDVQAKLAEQGIGQAEVSIAGKAAVESAVEESGQSADALRLSLDTTDDAPEPTVDDFFSLWSTPQEDVDALAAESAQEEASVAASTPAQADGATTPSAVTPPVPAASATKPAEEATEVHPHANAQADEEVPPEVSVSTPEPTVDDFFKLWSTPQEDTDTGTAEPWLPDHVPVNDGQIVGQLDDGVRACADESASAPVSYGEDDKPAEDGFYDQQAWNVDGELTDKAFTPLSYDETLDPFGVNDGYAKNAWSVDADGDMAQNASVQDAYGEAAATFDANGAADASQEGGDPFDAAQDDDPFGMYSAAGERDPEGERDARKHGRREKSAKPQEKGALFGFLRKKKEITQKNEIDADDPLSEFIIEGGEQSRPVGGQLYLSRKKGMCRGAIRVPQEQSVVIGRVNGKNRIVLSDGEISEDHAEISFDHGAYYLTDLDSTNGTFVNGEQLGNGRSVQLTPMDEIRFGTKRFYALFVDEK